MVVLTVLVLAISIGGFFPNLNWRLAWYSNPRPHFAVFSMVALTWFLGRRQQERHQKGRFQKMMPGLALLALLINLLVLAPLFVQPAVARHGDIGPRLTLAHLNTNRGRAALSDFSNLNVDVLLLQEVTPELAHDLPHIFNAYDLIYSHPLANTQGSTVLIHKKSPAEIVDTAIIHLPEESDRPLILTQLRWGDQAIRLLSLHLIRPGHAQADRYQQLELDAVAQWSQEIQQAMGEEVIVVGDFNVTPWSNRFLTLLAAGALHNSLRGYGLQNTWPSNLPLILGLPIDHAVYSNGLATMARSTQVVAGTDHALLEVSFGPSLP